MPPDVVAIAIALQNSGVDWVLVGGMAMTLHGSDHVTTDVDFAFAPDPANLHALCRALRELNARPRRWAGEGPYVWGPKLFSAPFLELESDSGPIHILTTLFGIESFSGLRSRAAVFDLAGTSIPAVSLEDLIRMKSSSDRTKDRVHLLELEALKRLEK